MLMSDKSPAVPDTDAFAESLMGFLDRSPTPFHATANLAEWLGSQGFARLDERDDWQLEAGGKYLITRNDSSLIALRWGRGPLRLLGAHTDSPCLRIKPMPDMHRQGCRQLAVEPYGGVLLGPWFDRDLSLAGRVGYADGAGQLHSALLDFRRPLAIIPSLAIHLDRGVNEKRSINKQRDLPPVLSLDAAAPSFAELLQRQLREEHGIKGEILSHEICAYDSMGATRLGLDGELLASARLDNLLSCHICAWALIHSRGAPLPVCRQRPRGGGQPLGLRCRWPLSERLPGAALRRAPRRGPGRCAADIGGQHPCGAPQSAGAPR